MALAVAGVPGTRARAVVVYSDDFSHTTLTNGAYSYNAVLNPLSSDGAAQIAGGELVLTNDKSDAVGNASGTLYVTTLMSAFGAPLNRVLSLNGDNVLTWTFNMGQTRPDPGPLTSGGYGAAFVLCSTGSLLLSNANGYAVVIGNPGTPDPVRLVKFTGGFQSSSGVPTTLISDTSQNAGSSHWSVRVTYRPAGNEWELFTRNDGADFINPTTGVYASSGLVSDNTLTGVNMSYVGMYWAYGSATRQSASFDNARLDVSPSPGARSLAWDGDANTGATSADVSGSWETASSWLDAAGGDHVSWSNARRDMAVFGGTGGSGTVTVNLGVPMTAGKVTFAADSPVHVLTGSALTLYGDAGTGLVVNESAVVRGGIAAAAGQAWTVAPAKTLTIDGAASIGLAGTLTLNGGGTVELARSAGTTTVPAGSKLLVAAGTTLRITGAGALTDAVTGQAADLDVQGTACVLPSAGAVVFGSLSIGDTGFLDLAGGDLLLRATTAAAARQLVTIGAHGGAWDGLGGIGSTAAAGSDGLIELAVMSGAEYRAIHGAAATFHGHPVVDTDALVKYTWRGDANFDGLVDYNDFLLTDAGYLFGGTGYSQGDFDGSGGVDTADYDILLRSFRDQTVILGGTGMVAPAVPSSAVPEPATLAILAGGMLLAGGRCRKSRN